MKMTAQEKIDLVVSAILEARKKYPKNCVKLELTEENRLKKLGKSETLRTLQKLEKELILHLYNSSPNYLPEMVIGGRWKYDKDRHAKILIPYSPDKQPEIIVEDYSITLNLYDAFDNWYSHHCYIKEARLEDFEPTNIAKIYEVVLKINEHSNYRLLRE